MKMTGAQVIVQCLLEQGVDTVFGYPGGQIIPFYDALYDAPIKHILTVHEQGAIHAADGYARASKRTGVCIATSGPGAANIVTGLATAYMDSVPLVAITGQVARAQIGSDAFQEVDIVSVTMAVTKHNFLVMEAKELPAVLRSAFAIAASGRPGPVLVDIPCDIQKAEMEYLYTCNNENEDDLIEPVSEEKIIEAMRIVEQGSHPVLLVGGGVIQADICQQVKLLAEKCDLPVVSTLMGLGSFPASHPQFLGITGMHGHVAANKAIHAADVILAIGSRFSDRVTGDKGKYAQDKRVIHIDIDPSEIGKNISANISLIGNIDQMTKALLRILPEKKNGEWWECIRKWREESETDYNAGELSAPWVMHNINQQVDAAETVFVTDVGQNQMWAAQHLKIEKPRSWLTSGGFGTMGFGLPAAIGAQIALPLKRIVHIAGDGGFKMTGLELYTVACQKLPIISIVLDNQALGMVRQWQKLFYQGRYSATAMPAFDFAAFANSCGIEASEVNTREQFDQAFRRALVKETPCVIVVKIPSDDLVMPMIAPGATLEDYVRA